MSSVNVVGVFRVDLYNVFQPMDLRFITYTIGKVVTAVGDLTVWGS